MNEERRHNEAPVEKTEAGKEQVVCLVKCLYVRCINLHFQCLHLESSSIYRISRTFILKRQPEK